MMGMWTMSSSLSCMVVLTFYLMIPIKAPLFKIFLDFMLYKQVSSLAITNTSSYSFYTLLMGEHASNGEAMTRVPSNWPDRGLNPMGDNLTLIPFG